MRFNNSYGNLSLTQDATSPEPSTYSSAKTNPSSPSKPLNDSATRPSGSPKSSKGESKDSTKLTTSPKERLLISINPKNKDFSESNRKDT